MNREPSLQRIHDNFHKMRAILSVAEEEIGQDFDQLFEPLLSGTMSPEEHRTMLLQMLDEATQ
jgi:hypothetical protein